MATFAVAPAMTAPLAGPGRVAGGGARRGAGGSGRCVARAASAYASAVAVAVAPSAARTHYEVLGVGAGASRGEIKAAYRRLAREVHPDVAAGAGAGAGEGFIRLHAAYATLADPDQRARYDRDMMIRRAPPTPAFRRRTWETDQCW